MPELDRKSVHRGTGIVRREGQIVGQLHEVNFIFENIGQEENGGDNREMCYGTVSGILEDRSVIDEFNTMEPPTVLMEITVEKEGQSITVYLERVEFIDDIPSSGVMEEIEFNGTVLRIE
jgi:hypothetical protein